MAKIILTNKSSRVFDTEEGRFHPGTSMEFDEEYAIKLLSYSGEIVNAEAVVSKVMLAKDKEIAKLKAKIEKLEAR